MRLDQASADQLRQWNTTLEQQYTSVKQSGLNLDLTRGKPNAEQLDLSNSLDGILNGEYNDKAGTDLRNYGGIDGIAEAKSLFSSMIEVSTDEILIGGNSSLTLMYFTVQAAMYQGVSDTDSAWINEEKAIKFLAPVPGYDRHFSICDHFNLLRFVRI